MYFNVCYFNLRLFQVLHDEDELQLHEGEGTPKTSRKKHHYDAATELNAVQWARENKSSKSGKFNVLSAAKKYHVSRGRIYEWIEHEHELKRQV